MSWTQFNSDNFENLVFKRTALRAIFQYVKGSTIHWNRVDRLLICLTKRVEFIKRKNEMDCQHENG